METPTNLLPEATAPFGLMVEPALSAHGSLFRMITVMEQQMLAVSYQGEQSFS